MFYADLTSQGYNLFRHHDRTFDLQYRLVSFATRVGGPDKGFGEGFDQFGLLQGVRPNWGDEETHGDVTNWGMWQAARNGGTATGLTPGAAQGGGQPSGSKTRTIPGWAQVWAAVSQEASAPGDANQGGGVNFPGGTTQGASTVDVLPVFSQNWDPDGRFETKTLPLPPGVEDVPGGVGGVVVTGTDEYSQQDLFIPCMPNQLIAPHEAGLASHGTTVYDLTSDSKPDKTRRAKLQTLTRVFEIGSKGGSDGVLQGLCGKLGEHALAIQMGSTRGGTNSRGAFADDLQLPNTQFPIEGIGLASHWAGGPLHVGARNDKHSYLGTDDGDRINSLHIWTGAYFYRDQTNDAPLEFGGDWEEPSSAGQLWQTFLRYDPRSQHAHPKGLRSGLWRWETRVPVYYPPPPGQGGTNSPANPDADQGGKDPARDGGFSTNHPANPDADQTTTSPGRDQSFGTNTPANPDADQATTSPSADQTTTTSPSSEQGLGTNHPANPDADQGGGGGGGGKPNPDADQGGPGGGDGPQIDDGPTFQFGPKKGQPITRTATGTPNKPFGPAVAAAAEAEAIAIISGRIRANPVERDTRTATGQFGVPNDATDVVDQQLEPTDSTDSLPPLPPPTGDRVATGLQSLATLNEFQVPGIVFQPQPFLGRQPDFRNSTDWQADSAEQVASNWPVVARLESFCNQTTDGEFVYNSVFGRYGPDAQGMISVMPPNVGGESVITGVGNTPFSETTPTTTFNLYQSQLSWGTPLASGLPGSGVTITMSGGVLTGNTVDASGTITDSHQLYPPTGGSGGLTTGTLAGRPGTPGAQGDTWVATDKFDDGTSGGADATDFFAVGILDGLMWAKVALANFKQTISSPWTFSSGNTVTGSFTTSGGGTIDANKLLGKTIGSLVTNNALIYNGTSLVFGTLSVAGGGTGLTSLTANAIYYANSTSSFASFGAPDARGGQIVSSTTNPIWSYNITGGTQTGANTAGSDRNVEGMVGTGTGVGGAIVFRTAPPGGSGSSPNSLVNVASVTGRGSFLVNATGAKIAQAATDGFLYVPQCLTGAPSGTPTAITGGIALVVGSDNHLYFNPTGSAWVQVDPAAGGSNTLNQVLTAGNTTGGKDIEITNGDSIQGHDALTSTGGGSVTVRAGNATVGNNTGGELILASGTSSGTVPTATGGVDVAIQAEGETVAQFFGNQFYTGSSPKAIFYMAPYETDSGATSHVTIRTAWLNPSIDYSGATHNGAYEVLVVDPTIVNEPTGSNLLAAFRKNGTNQLTVDTTGKVTTYNKVATAGGGVPAVYGFGRSTGQTGNVGSVATYTVGGSDGSFWISANANLTAFTAGTMAVQCDYTDEGGTARTVTFNFSGLTGTLGTAIGTTLGPYEGLPLHIRCQSATTITIKTVGTGFTGTYNVEGVITQIA